MQTPTPFGPNHIRVFNLSRSAVVIRVKVERGGKSHTITIPGLGFFDVERQTLYFNRDIFENYRRTGIIGYDDNQVIAADEVPVDVTLGVGLLSGGVITPGTGLSVNIAAGVGILEMTDATTGLVDVQQIVWDNQTLALPADSDVYVFENSTSLPGYSTTRDNETVVLLGRVVTDDTGVLFIDLNPLQIQLFTSKVDNYHRDALGALYANGSILGDAGNLQLQVTSGVYYYAVNKFEPTGGDPITFTRFYRNVSTFVSEPSQQYVDNTVYDNAGVLTPIPAGEWVKHSVYLVGGPNEQYFLLTGQTTFSALTLAEQGALPQPPEYFKDGVVLIGSVIVQQGNPQIVECLDDRPTINSQRSATLQAITYHRNLLGLTAPADDHTQYLHIDGRRAMTGDLNMGGNNIVDVGHVGGINPVYGTVADTVAEGNDPRFTVQNRVRVKQNPGYQEYSSIAAAIASITTASATNPFIVDVGPGVYIEPQIVMKSYITIVGSPNATIITPSNPAVHQIVCADNCAFSNLTFTGVTGAGQASIYTANFDVQILNCTFGVVGGTNTIGILCNGGPTPTTLIATDIAFIGTYTSGIVISSSTTVLQAVLSRIASNATQATSDFFVVSGAAASVVVTGMEVEGSTAINAINLSDGANLTVSNVIAQNFNIGLWVRNVGAAPLITIVDGALVDCTTDIIVDHPGTTGTLQVNAHDEKTVLNSGTIGNIALFLLDPDGDFVIGGRIKAQQPNGAFTDANTLVFQAAPMGYLSGGQISVVSGLTVAVSSGYGYIDTDGEVLGPGSILRLDWPTTNVTLAANANVYLYFDQNTTLNVSPVLPDTAGNVLVGRVVTDSSGVLFIDQSGELAHHKANEINNMLRQAVGPIYASGSNVSADGPLGLDVSAGTYFFADLQFDPSGGTPISWTSFYQNGSGGYIEIPSQTNVDNMNWDPGTGSLAPLGSGYFARHALYVVGQGANERYFLVYSQTQYSALTLAEQGNNPTPPPSFTDGVAIIAAIIVQQGQSSIVEIRDQRPRISFAPSGVAATTYHHNLLGLTVGDDHTQYWLLAGRAGGITAYGGTNPSDNLVLDSTSNSTKGNIILGPTSTAKVGIATSTPAATLDVEGTFKTLAFYMPPTGPFQEGYVLTADAVGNGTWQQSKSGFVYVQGSFPEVATVGRYLDFFPLQSSNIKPFFIFDTAVLREVSIESTAPSTGTVGIFEYSDLSTPIQTISLTGNTSFSLTGLTVPISAGDRLVMQVTSGSITSPIVIAKVQ